MRSLRCSLVRGSFTVHFRVLAGFSGLMVDGEARQLAIFASQTPMQAEPTAMSTESEHLFRFDLDGAIRDQLIARLESSPLVTLAKSVGPPQSGIYGLYWHGSLVYVGKATKELTKSKRHLRTRLNEHVIKLTGRVGISPDQVRCRFLTFESEWWVFAAEYALITHYKPEWNYSGFGSKVPGRGRPGTSRVSTWNEQFPLVGGQPEPSVEEDEAE